MKEVRRDFTAIAEMPDGAAIEHVRIVATAQASYLGNPTTEPKILAKEPYVVEPEPPEKPNPKCPKCGKEIGFLNAQWPATVVGMAELYGGELRVEFESDINRPKDIARSGEQVYCCPECDEELFKAGEEVEVYWFLENKPTEE